MPRQLSAVVVLFMSLTVILHDSHQMREKAFPESRHHLQSTTAATGQATAKPTNPGPHKAVAARSMDGHITSPTAVKTSNSENLRNTTVETPTATTVMTKSNPSASPVILTLATPKSHPITEATVGPTVAHSQSPIKPPASTAGTSPSTVSHTTGKTIQHSEQTSLPKTLSMAPHKSTASWKSTPLTHAPGTSTGSHNVTQTMPPVTIVPGPTLAPQPSPAKTGIYQVLNGSSLCIKAEMGIQLIVQEKESVFSPQRYFNIDPNTTQASGNCGSRKSSLLLNLKGGSVNFTFTKEENSYFISEVEAYLTVSNPEKAYKGVKSAMVMFETVVGHSFKCVSEQSIQLSPQLQLKTMNVQLQAFDFEGDHFGNADECFSDRNRREIPVAVGLSIAGLLVIWLTACLVARKRPNRGYERIWLGNPVFHLRAIKGLSRGQPPPDFLQWTEDHLPYLRCHSISNRKFMKFSNSSVIAAYLGNAPTLFKVDECSSDYTIVLPVIGAIVVGLCLVGIGIYTIRLRRQSSGYQRL